MSVKSPSMMHLLGERGGWLQRIDVVTDLSAELKAKLIIIKAQIKSN